MPGARLRAARPGRGLCRGTDQRWRVQGKPDLGEFIAATADPAGRPPATLAACRVPGCYYGRKARVCATGTIQRWQRAGALTGHAGVAALPAVAAGGPAAACRIPYCDLWVHVGLPFCLCPRDRWTEQGGPDIGEFAAQLRGRLGSRSRAHRPERPGRRSCGWRCSTRFRAGSDDGAKVRPGRGPAVRHVPPPARRHSLLDRDEDAWRQHMFRRFRRAGESAATAPGRDPDLCAPQVEELPFGRGWDVEYPRDTWRLRNLGIHDPIANVRFGRIPQPWLKKLAKRWSGGGWQPGRRRLGYPGRSRSARFSAPRSPPGERRPPCGQVDPAAAGTLPGRPACRVRRPEACQAEHIGKLNGFLHAVRRHGWDDALPASAMFYPEDYPKRGELLPRASPSTSWPRSRTPPTSTGGTTRPPADHPDPHPLRAAPRGRAARSLRLHRPDADGPPTCATTTTR